MRKRAMEYVEPWHGYKEAGGRYGVSERMVCAWVRLKKETGSLIAQSVSRSPHKLHDEELSAHVMANPDAYLREIAVHFKCCVAAMHKALKRLKIVYRKTPFIPGKGRRATGTIYRFRKNVSTKSAVLC
ncbi:MAG: transposase [Holosporaceae bacterium]|nr:transposase [Holosporaceae bacterium]